MQGAFITLQKLERSSKSAVSVCSGGEITTPKQENEKEEKSTRAECFELGLYA